MGTKNTVLAESPITNSWLSHTHTHKKKKKISMNYGSQQEECKGKNTKWNVIKQDAVSPKTNCMSLSFSWSNHFEPFWQQALKKIHPPVRFASSRVILECQEAVLLPCSEQALPDCAEACQLELQRSGKPTQGPGRQDKQSELFSPKMWILRCHMTTS